MPYLRLTSLTLSFLRASTHPPIFPFPFFQTSSNKQSIFAFAFAFPSICLNSTPFVENLYRSPLALNGSATKEINQGLTTTQPIQPPNHQPHLFKHPHNPPSSASKQLGNRSSKSRNQSADLQQKSASYSETCHHYLRESQSGEPPRRLLDMSASTQPSTPFHESYSSKANSLVGTTSSPSTSFRTSSINNILSELNPSKNTMENKHHQSDISISMLLSPPEATPLDNFNQTSSQSTMASQAKPLFPIQAGHLPLSPPISPATKAIVTEESSTLATRDPILYPHAEATSPSSSQLPLFGERAATKRVVSRHVAERDPSLFRDASPPRQVEYELALEFKSHIMQVFDRSNKLAYLNRERAQLLEDQAMRSGVRRYPALAPATYDRNRRPNKVVKTPSSGGKKIRQPTIKAPRATPEPGVKRVAREDKDFDQLPDYSPPISSLPDKYNSLKVDWRGAPIDLENDPHRHLLHRDELLLAANLRLDCATYLTSKRRIFKARIDCLRTAKEFRKTDAQQACKIDVNKASKLWSAYEKVGWLNRKWVEKYV